MNMTKEASQILRDAVVYAGDHHFEYVTPEMILLALCEDGIFQEAYSDCNGQIDDLVHDLGAYIDQYVEHVEGDDPDFSIGSTYALTYAGYSAKNSGCGEIEIRHLLHGIWQLEESYAVYVMKRQGVTEADLLRKMAILEELFALQESSEKLEPEDEEALDEEEDEEDSDRPIGDRWKLYAPCLNDTLGDVNPLIGREEELERTIQILCRKDKNNPLHIGEPGVGKTAITYGLVQRIREHRVPDPLADCRIFALDLGGMLAGTQYRGDFEKRFKKVLSEIGKEEKPIIYIDEIHNLSGAGAVGESSFDASNMLKPYLADGHIRFLGATTFEEYKKYFEKNKGLVRRFQNVEIKEPDEEETVRILEGLKPGYEAFHHVVYDEEVIPYAVAMSTKYIHERFLPDKAIDLMDEAGAYRKLHPVQGEVQAVDKAVVMEVLNKICRVPVETIQSEEHAGLATLNQRLSSRIFGQDEAIIQVVNAVKFSKAGLLEEGKPLASLLFVGPTGVGKTEIARCLAQELGIKLLRFDMSEYGEKHAVAKLIGSPAGYVGYEEGGLLTEAVRKHPSAVLLLDEIEKAHPDIYHILLQVMDYATLTDNQGRKADFRNVVLIMTSNAGASRIGKKGIGFQSTGQDSGVIMEEVKRTFQPEFRNRLNDVVVFHGMDENMAARVVEKKVKELGKLLKKRSVHLKTTVAAMELIRKKGISEEYGAREVDRVIRNEIKPLLVDDLLFGRLKHGGNLLLDAEENAFVISVEDKPVNRKASKRTVAAMT